MTTPITLLRGESVKDGLQKKVNFAIRLLRSIPTDSGPVSVVHNPDCPCRKKVDENE